MKITTEDRNSFALTVKSAPTAQVTGKPGTNSSTLSGRHNPNKDKPEGGAQPAPKDSPSIGTTFTKPNFQGGPKAPRR